MTLDETQVKTEAIELQTIVLEMLNLMRLSDCDISYDENVRKISIIADPERYFILKQNLAKVVTDFNLLIQLMAKKAKQAPVFIDINNYRLERERIIIELAKAAARKVVAMKSEVALPHMNAYERRLVHAELATNPAVKTESMGIGKTRFVVVKLVE